MPALRSIRCLVGTARVRRGFVLLLLAAGCGEDDGREPSAPQPTTGEIAGRVTSTEGDPVAGARVGTVPATAIAFTDAQGGYRLADLDPGSYAVVAVAEGRGAGVGTAQVDAGETATVDLQLESAAAADSIGAASGLVLRRSGEPAPAGTSVTIFAGGSSCDALVPPAAVAMTDAAGRFVVTDLTVGSYVACVRLDLAGQPFEGRAAFVVNAGEITAVDVEIARDTGQSTDPDTLG